jgi:HprK-related kinase A
MIIDSGLHTFRIAGLPKHIEASLNALYGDCDHKRFVDYQISLVRKGLRKYIKPQVAITIEGQQPFNPVPPSKLLPSVEWAMNWCVAAYEHNNLLFHASVVEKNNKSIIFPAQSGSGKSTLSTYLALNGWHLYYDEMAVINIENSKTIPVFRPSSLKNDSIEIISNLSNKINISPITENTHKGRIAHVMPHSRQQFDTFTPCKPCAVVSLNFKRDSKTQIFELDKAIGMSSMMLNAFNYSVIGKPAFDALVDLSNSVRFFEITYSDMDEIDEFLSELVDY